MPPSKLKKRLLLVADVVVPGLMALVLVGSLFFTIPAFAKLRALAGQPVTFSPEAFAGLLTVCKAIFFCMFPIAGVLFLVNGWELWKLRSELWKANSRVSETERTCER